MRSMPNPNSSCPTQPNNQWKVNFIVRQGFPRLPFMRGFRPRLITSVHTKHNKYIPSHLRHSRAVRTSLDMQLAKYLRKARGSCATPSSPQVICDSFHFWLWLRLKKLGGRRCMPRQRNCCGGQGEVGEGEGGGEEQVVSLRAVQLSDNT